MKLNEDGSNYNEFLNSMPKALQREFENMQEDASDGLNYDQLANYLRIFESYGYTFEYYLDAEPYNFRTLDLEVTE